MSDYKEFSDLKLLNGLRRSDELAYTEIYRRYFELVFIQAYKKLKDEEQAKDIVQSSSIYGLAGKALSRFKTSLGIW